MSYTEEQLHEISGDDVVLSDKELEMFSLMTPQETEEYRALKYPEYIELTRIEKLLGSGRIQGDEYELEIYKLKNIQHRCPTAEDAKAEIQERLIEEHDL